MAVGGITLESLAASRIVEPETCDVRRLTAPDQVWSDVAPWPWEDDWCRMDAVSRAHHLAIIRDDRAWLIELDAHRDVLQLDAFATQLQAQGEIGFGPALAGLRPFGWTADDMATLIDEGVLRNDVARDQTWIALAAKHFLAARRALTEYENLFAKFGRVWDAAPEKGVSEALAQPDLVLQVERRTLFSTE